VRQTASGGDDRRTEQDRDHRGHRHDRTSRGATPPYAVVHGTDGTRSDGYVEALVGEQLAKRTL
jgi:hypothetical protein